MVAFEKFRFLDFAFKFLKKLSLLLIPHFIKYAHSDLVHAIYLLAAHSHFSALFDCLNYHFMKIILFSTQFQEL